MKMKADEETALVRLIESLASSRREQATVPIKEYYTTDEVSRLLVVHVQRVREMARRDEDPLPLIVFPDSRKNAFIHRDDLRDWLRRNGIPYAVARPRGGRR